MASATAATAASKGLVFQKRILSHFDSLALAPTDLTTIQSTTTSHNVALVSWLLPVGRLQQLVHSRFEVETIARDNEDTPYGLLTMVSSQFELPNTERRTLYERMTEPKVVTQVVYKTSVVDRQHWHRTAWTFFSASSSALWARNPRKLYGIDIDLFNVKITAPKFDEERSCYGGAGELTEEEKKGAAKQSNNRDSYYTLEVPDDGLKLSLKDSGRNLFDHRVRVTDGFVDNESALRVVGMHRESIMWGHEGSLVRQPAWSTPILPNTASLVPATFSPGRSMSERFGIAQEDFPTTPLVCWLVQRIPKTYIYAVESMIEEENDMSGGWSSQGEQPFQDRVQKRAQNRYDVFKGELRSRVYEDLKDEQK